VGNGSSWRNLNLGEGFFGHVLFGIFNAEVGREGALAISGDYQSSPFQFRVAISQVSDYPFHRECFSA